MSVIVSHTAIEKYKTCGKMYELHYLEKIRSTTVGSALLFGNAIDDALNALLLTKKKQLSPEEQEIVKRPAKEIFINEMTYYKLNREAIFVPTSTAIDYSRKDLNWDILTDEDYRALQIKYDGVDPQNEYNRLTEREMFPEYTFTDRDHEFRQYVQWLSLKRKGLLLIDEYEKVFMPIIEEVYSIQKPVILESEQGDKVRGFIDFEAKIKGHGDVLVDNKTSSIKYKEDSVKTSPQLAIYQRFSEMEKAAFFVLNKIPKENKVKTCLDCENVWESRHKTCPSCKSSNFDTKVQCEIVSQCIIDKPCLDNAEEVLVEIEDFIEEIKAGKFEENRNNCYQYGRKCAYYDLCRSGNMAGLVDMKEEKND